MNLAFIVLTVCFAIVVCLHEDRPSFRTRERLYPRSGSPRTRSDSSRTLPNGTYNRLSPEVSQQSLLSYIPTSNTGSESVSISTINERSHEVSASRRGYQTRSQSPVAKFEDIGTLTDGPSSRSRALSLQPAQFRNTLLPGSDSSIREPISQTNLLTESDRHRLEAQKMPFEAQRTGATTEQQGEAARELFARVRAEFARADTIEQQQKQAAKQRFAGWRTDPIVAEARKKHQREYAVKRRADPVKGEAIKEKQREYMVKWRANQARVAQSGKHQSEQEGAGKEAPQHKSLSRRQKKLITPERRKENRERAKARLLADAETVERMKEKQPKNASEPGEERQADPEAAKQVGEAEKAEKKSGKQGSALQRQKHQANTQKNVEKQGDKAGILQWKGKSPRTQRETAADASGDKDISTFVQPVGQSAPGAHQQNSMAKQEGTAGMFLPASKGSLPMWAGKSVRTKQVPAADAWSNREALGLAKSGELSVQGVRQKPRKTASPKAQY